MRRHAENKQRSARSFNKGHKKTAKKNKSIMRGGWRL